MSDLENTPQHGEHDPSLTSEAEPAVASAALTGDEAVVAAVEELQPAESDENVDSTPPVAAVVPEAVVAVVQAAGGDEVQAAEVQAAGGDEVQAAEVQAAEVQAAGGDEVQAADSDDVAVDAESVESSEVVDEAAAVTEPDPASFRYQPGDIVPGTITAVGANGIEADLGSGDTAVIPRSEIDGDPAVGDAIEGAVIKHQGGTGRYVISPKRAGRARAWSRVLDAFEAKVPITGTVTDVTKGGLIVDLGLRAFLPESLIDVRKPSNPRALIGTQVTVMVVECEKLSGEAAAKERRSEKVVVNRRVLREVERKALRERLLNTLQAGDRMVGTVTALTEFGAFVDLGGAEGLVHVSELAHRNVAKPGDVVKVGQELDVIVLDVKADRGKISLSHKATLPSPWQKLQTMHKVGDLVYGTVSSIAAFGAFVAVEGDGFTLEGLIHVSELSRYRVESPSEVVNVGEGVWTQILAIEPEKRRLSLSLRRALEA